MLSRKPIISRNPLYNMSSSCWLSAADCVFCSCGHVRNSLAAPSRCRLFWCTGIGAGVKGNGFAKNKMALWFTFLSFYREGMLPGMISAWHTAYQSFGLGYNLWWQNGNGRTEFIVMPPWIEVNVLLFFWLVVQRVFVLVQQDVQSLSFGIVWVACWRLCKAFTISIFFFIRQEIS